MDEHTTDRDRRADVEDREDREDRDDLITAGEEVSDEFGLDQPTDAEERDEGAGRDEPTPNPADIAP